MAEARKGRLGTGPAKKNCLRPSARQLHRLQQISEPQRTTCAHCRSATKRVSPCVSPEPARCRRLAQQTAMQAAEHGLARLRCSMRPPWPISSRMWRLMQSGRDASQAGVNGTSASRSPRRGLSPWICLSRPTTPSRTLLGASMAFGRRQGCWLRRLTTPWTESSLISIGGPSALRVRRRPPSPCLHPANPTTPRNTSSAPADC